jgi:hypothetical protein
MENINKIQIPDNFEIDKIEGNSIILKEKTKKIKSLLEYCNQYVDLYNNKLYAIKNIWYNVLDREIDKFLSDISKGQAIDILQLIANDYNGDWKADWSDRSNIKYFIYFDTDWKLYRCNSSNLWITANVFFKNDDFDFKPYIKLLDNIYK